MCLGCQFTKRFGIKLAEITRSTHFAILGSRVDIVRGNRQGLYMAKWLGLGEETEE